MTEAQKYVIRDLRREVVALQRERDEARAELDECRRLLREAVEYRPQVGRTHLHLAVSTDWYEAAKAAGGE